MNIYDRHDERGLKNLINLTRTKMDESQAPELKRAYAEELDRMIAAATRRKIDF